MGPMLHAAHWHNPPAPATVSSSAAARVTPCSSALPSTPAQCSHRRAAIPLYCNGFARRPQRPESSATAGAGAGGGWGIVWLAVGGGAMVVRVGPRTGEATNTPAVEADDAGGGGKHGQGASATGRTAGSGWGCRCFAGHSVCRGRIRCQCACPRTNDGRTASDHQDEQARACAQRGLRPADVPHNLNCRRRHYERQCAV